MLKVIGFVVVWLISAVLLAMVINTMRAKKGQNINDSTTAFFEGFIWGPIGVLAALDPKERAIGRSTPKLLGGIVGCIVAYNIFVAL